MSPITVRVLISAGIGVTAGLAQWGLLPASSPFTMLMSSGVLITVGWIGLTVWNARKLNQAMNVYEGHCAKCGYDLRATPDRCPECGKDSDSWIPPERPSELEQILSRKTPQEATTPAPTHVR